MRVDFDTLPKSTPQSVRKLVAELVAENETLHHTVAVIEEAANAEAADAAIAKADANIKPRYDRSVFKRVNVRHTNRGETYYNCCLAGEMPAGSHAASKALGHPIADVQRNEDGTPKIMRDRNNNRWINLLPTLRGAK